MSKDSTVRLSIEIPAEVNEELAKICPWGTKADTIRSLIELLMREWAQNRHIVTDLLNGNCKLIIAPPTIQILNTRCETCDDD